MYMAVNILAVMIQDNQDFNNFIYNGTSTLRVNTPLYIGGVPYTLDPFPAAIQVSCQTLQIGRLSSLSINLYRIYIYIFSLKIFQMTFREFGMS